MKAVPLPSPEELGFPSKFRAWRDDQIAAIDRSIGSSRRWVAATAPTGFGKTLYGVASGLLHPGVNRFAYLTADKNLQKQIYDDFETMGVVDVRGQNNYPCIAVDPGERLARFRRHRGYVGCDDGPCHVGVSCQYAPDSRDRGQIRPDCKYYGRDWDARRASFISTNDAFWLSQRGYGQGLGEFDLLICDEAHAIADQLESFLTFEITAEDAQYAKTILVDSDEIQNWRDWANHHKAKLASRIEQREQMPPQDLDGAHDLRRMKTTLGKLERLVEIDPLDWIVEREGSKRAKFTPIKVSKYAEEFLFQGIKKVILMSATLTRKTLQLLGIDPSQAEIMEFKSSFPVARRPVIAIETTPPVRVNARMHDTDKLLWMRRIDRLIEPRRHLKAFISTVSYARMQELFKCSEHKDLMIIHESGDAKWALEHFVNFQGPQILVSPAMDTGIDLLYDLCRYIIIGKVPIPDTRGALMQIRVKQDPELPYYLAMQKLVQATGRGMRAPDDWCETFIVDDTFGDWFFARAKKHAPRYFVDAVEFSDVLPEPLKVA